MIVSPSILSMDFDNVKKEEKRINKTDCEMIHLDVMDGKFVPNTTFDYEFIKSLNFKKVYDTHLMIENPLSVIDKYLEVSDIVTFHYEAESVDDLRDFFKNHRPVKHIGLSIKPSTDVKVLDEFLPYLDLVLIMSVEPGKGGQKFMEEALPKIEHLNHKKLKYGYNYIIEVDGGINKETAKACKKAGCDAVVAGSYIFKNKKYQKQINDIR